MHTYHVILVRSRLAQLPSARGIISLSASLFAYLEICTPIPCRTMYIMLCVGRYIAGVGLCFFLYRRRPPS
ncbi:hypothetical protein F4775DRAFT_571044 [Biscogniauxia sp. FL1348]|nr:hypothetical protein F4775DRAFT_571044 [Biscogniauxia sp. FL1348]